MGQDLFLMKASSSNVSQKIPNFHG